MKSNSDKNVSAGGVDDSQDPEGIKPAANEFEQRASEESSFPGTVRHLVEPLSDKIDDVVRAAWHKLWVTYEPVLTAYAQCGGREHEAEDIASAFKLHLLAIPVRYECRPGTRFRHFLRHIFRNFRIDYCKKKRLQTDTIDEANQGGGEEIDCRQFDALLALQIYRNVMAGLKREYQGSGRGAMFESLASKLTSETQDGFYDQVAKQLGLKWDTDEEHKKVTNCLKADVSRLRKKFREAFRDEVEKVCAPEDVNAEVRELFAALIANYGTSIA
jgi:DNA-directed RNA polymerase specialized sigma24 family protein